MTTNLQLTATSGEEPLNLEQVKKFLRQNGTQDDGLIEDLIKAARAKAEQVLGRSLMVHTYLYEVYEHSGVIDLPYPPHGTVSAVTYWDGSTFTALVENTGFTVYGIDSKYISVSVGYDRVRITYATTAYNNYDVNRLMMELIAVWYDNRPDAEELEAKIVKKISHYKVWQAI